ncbi:MULTISPECIES: hypothetical protein [unclassified Streptomyces]|uniref:hypothetical protein n=1 Tax=unclassified Streptomyces TaxID=2593676 RepID=UPI0006AF3717|nr:MULTISPECIES: hypothetical protein [unclassified Streptomyces]KOX19220.1 hypothetical protein ADL06_29825 [Streptomyces sp. NRRL F-6491]KOX37076.1 hypothetical protein ADL08_30485 [Streptomyces sp. NRRL F-6492]
MAQVYFQVNVPIRNSVQPEQCGLHVFTGPADTWSEALRIARETCDAAAAARDAGSALPRRRPDGWGARGLRPGWVFDWTAATVDAWEHDGLFRIGGSSPSRQGGRHR